MNNAPIILSQCMHQYNHDAVEWQNNLNHTKEKYLTSSNLTEFNIS